MRLAWQYRRRAQVLGWPRRFLCRWGKHHGDLYMVGHTVGKACRWCKLPVPMLPGEVELYLSWMHLAPEPSDQEKPEDKT